MIITRKSVNKSNNASKRKDFWGLLSLHFDWLCPKSDISDDEVDEIIDSVKKERHAAGILGKYANHSLIGTEREVFEDALVARHTKHHK